MLNAFGPVLLEVRDELGTSRAMAGLHSTALATGTLLAGAAGERLRIRLGPLGVVRAATVALAISTVALGLARTVALTLPSAVVIGAAGTLLLVVAPGVLSDRHGSAAGSAIAEAHATASLLGVLAPLAVGASLAAFGAWLPALLVVVLGVLPVLGALAPSMPHGVAPPARLSHAAPARLPAPYWWWWTALFFAVATEFSVLLWAADDARERLGLSTAAATLAPSAFLLGMGFARATGARLMLGRPPDALFGRSAALAVCAFVLWRATDVTAVALLGVGFVGCGVGLLYPLSLAGAMRTAPGAEAQASTRSALASGLAIGIGPLVLGALADVAGLGAASWVVPGLLAGGIVAAAWARRAVFAAAATG